MQLSSKVVIVFDEGRELPKYVKFVCSKFHISGSIKTIQKEYIIQPTLLKGEMEHDLITLSNYKQHENQWKPYLIDDVLGLAYGISKHGNDVQKNRCFI